MSRAFLEATRALAAPGCGSERGVGPLRAGRAPAEEGFAARAA